MEGVRTVVVFRAGDRYAVDVDAVHEVLPFSEPRPVDGMPAFLEGVIEARGVVVPVVDLRTRLGVAGEEGRARILALELAGAVVGTVVDDVYEVREVDADAVASPPKDAPGWVDGTIQDEDGTLTLVRPDGLLTDEETAALIGA